MSSFRTDVIKNSFQSGFRDNAVKSRFQSTVPAYSPTPARAFNRESIGRILLASGFSSSLFDPFDFQVRGGVELSINGIRFSGVNSVYLGEESITVQPANASVFYARIKEFSMGGERRF